MKLPRRNLLQSLWESLRQQFVVENRRLAQQLGKGSLSQLDRLAAPVPSVELDQFEA